MTQKNWPLDKSRKLLESYLYIASRSVDFLAVGLGQVEAFEAKLELGASVGLLGRFLEDLEQRVRQIHPGFGIRIWDPAFASQFNTLINNMRTDADICSAGAIVMSFFKNSIETSISSIDCVLDQPTHFLLKRAHAGCFDDVEVPSQAWTLTLGPVCVDYDERAVIPFLHSIPRRPSTVVLDSQPYLIKKDSQGRGDDLTTSQEALKRFLHFVAMEIEFSAMELCGKTIAMHREMPLAFKCDFARQIHDETRHAIAVWNRLREIGGYLGEFPYSQRLWKCFNMGQNLAQRLALQNIVMEGNAFENGLSLEAELTQAGDAETCRIWEFLNMDEMSHVQYGNKWLLHLTGHNESEYARQVLLASRNLRISIPREGTKLDVTARMDAGFPASFLDHLQKVKA